MSSLRFRRWLTWLSILASLTAAGWFATDYVERHPEDFPWTELDLRQPVGSFTGRKLTALGEDAPLCRALLDRAGATYTALDDRGSAPCAVTAAVRLREGTRHIGLEPAAAGMTCPVAAALAMWEWQVVQPAARRHFGRNVRSIQHLGTYSCRRIGGREEGDFSEHATANAIDVAAFVMDDGRRISLIDGWSGPDSAFLREVRDGACDLFATVLSPDYNEAHRDHLHLDQARRASGWRACR